MSSDWSGSKPVTIARLIRFPVRKRVGVLFSLLLVACLPVTATIVAFNIFGMMEIVLIGKLGVNIVVLVGGASTVLMVFNALLNGARLAVLQDIARGYLNRSYRFLLARAGLTIGVLFWLFFVVCFRWVASYHAAQYNLAVYELIAGIQIMLMVVFYCFSAVLYGYSRESAVAITVVSGLLVQVGLIAVIVFTDIVPVPKYLAVVVSTVVGYCVQVAVSALFISRTPTSTRPTVKDHAVSVGDFIRRVLPVSMDRAGVFVGFLLIFGVISRGSTEVVAGYVVLSRLIGVIFVVAYATELILTREVGKTDAVGLQMRLLGTSGLVAACLGAVLVAMVVATSKPIVQFMFPDVAMQSISTALAVGICLQVFNYSQILCGGFLRAVGYRVYVFMVNVFVFAGVMPLGFAVFPVLYSNQIYLWSYMGSGYILALAIFTAKVMRYVSKPQVWHKTV